LAAAPPRLSGAERDALLYQCGFAAGRQAAAGATWRWRVAAAAALLLAAGLGVRSTSQRQAGPDQQMAIIRPATTERTPGAGETARERTSTLPEAFARRPRMLTVGSSWELVEAPPPRDGESAGDGASGTEERGGRLTVGSFRGELGL
jgi:hypothetical protein